VTSSEIDTSPFALPVAVARWLKPFRTTDLNRTGVARLHINIHSARFQAARPGAQVLIQIAMKNLFES